MASYPTTGSGFFQRAGTREDWVDDLQSDRSVNGVIKVRAFYPAFKRVFVVMHLMNPTDRATLQTFYATNRTLPVTFLFMPNNTTYTVLFMRAPQLNYKGAQALVEVSFAEQ